MHPSRTVVTSTPRSDDSSSAPAIRERSRSDGTVRVSTGDSEAHFRVLRLVGHGGIRRFDEIRGGAEAEQLQREPRKGGDRGMLHQRHARPLLGEQSALRLTQVRPLRSYPAHLPSVRARSQGRDAHRHRRGTGGPPRTSPDCKSAARPGERRLVPADNRHRHRSRPRTFDRQRGSSAAGVLRVGGTEHPSSAKRVSRAGRKCAIADGIAAFADLAGEAFFVAHAPVRTVRTRKETAACRGGSAVAVRVRGAVGVLRTLTNRSAVPRGKRHVARQRRRAVVPDGAVRETLRCTLRNQSQARQAARDFGKGRGDLPSRAATPASPPVPLAPPGTARAASPARAPTTTCPTRATRAAPAPVPPAPPIPPRPPSPPIPPAPPTPPSSSEPAAPAPPLPSNEIPPQATSGTRPSVVNSVRPQRSTLTRSRMVGRSRKLCATLEIRRILHSRAFTMAQLGTTNDAVATADDRKQLRERSASAGAGRTRSSLRARDSFPLALTRKMTESQFAGGR